MFESTSYSLINSMRTGNLVVDMLVAMLIPFLLGHLKTYGVALVAKIKKKIMPLTYERHIMKKQQSSHDAGLIKGPEPRDKLFHAIENKLHHSSATQGTWVSLAGHKSIIKHPLEKLTYEYDGITIRYEITTEKESYILSGNDEDVLDAWIEDALDMWYGPNTNQRTRFHYQHMKSHGDFQKFSAQPLSDSFPFESVFFPEKQNMLNIVEQFQTRSGPYKKNRLPHKLGLLLHGPPGTGKTSFIKALAHFCNRHVVSVPLGSIKSNEELTKIMFPTDGNYAWEKRAFDMHEVIYIFEDIDAMTLGQDRDQEVGEDKTKKEEKAAALNLSDVLNVLDGVIDTPGRIVVMTTNHPDKLDPALIRPGRVDFKVRLGFLLYNDAIDIFKYSMERAPSKSEKKEIRELCEKEITPAKFKSIYMLKKFFEE